MPEPSRSISLYLPLTTIDRLRELAKNHYTSPGRYAAMLIDERHTREIAHGRVAPVMAESPNEKKDPK